MDAEIILLAERINTHISAEEREALDKYNAFREKGFQGKLTHMESMELAMLEIRLGL